MLNLSSTAQQELEQLSAMFRDVAEILAELRGQLLVAGFSEEGAENMCEIFFAVGLDQ